MQESVYRQFADAGAKLLALGINTTHSGNISIRGESTVYITRTGSRLDRLSESDIVSVPVNEANQGIASMELPMHLAIYQMTQAKAILHAHPPYTIVLSLIEDAIYPVDNEAFMYLGEVAVLNPEQVSGSPETGRLIGSHFVAGSKIIVLRSHGSFAIGENLEEALHWTSTLERSCQMGYLLRTISEYKYQELMRNRRMQMRKKNTPVRKKTGTDTSA